VTTANNSIAFIMFFIAVELVFYTNNLNHKVFEMYWLTSHQTKNPALMSSGILDFYYTVGISFSCYQKGMKHSKAM
jgi:hypothetical protein